MSSNHNTAEGIAIAHLKIVVYTSSPAYTDNIMACSELEDSPLAERFVFPALLLWQLKVAYLQVTDENVSNCSKSTSVGSAFNRLV